MRIFTRFLGARALLVTLTSLGLSACGAATEPEPERQGLEGVWKTEGYGHTVSIEAGEARFYETTAVSCLPSFVMSIAPATEEGVEAIFELAEMGLQVEVLPGEDDDERWMRIASLASQRRLRRARELPSLCGAEPATDAPSVFDVFWQTYAEHYPFFELRGMDWPALRDRERAKLTGGSSGEELFEVLKGMIEPLQDAHTFLVAPELQRGYGGRRPDPSPLSDEAVASAFSTVDQSYLLEAPTALCNDQIFLGWLEGGLRYLRLRSFNNYGSDFGDGLVCLESALDQLLESPNDIAGLVIDIRVNDGGADTYGLAIASRLASDEYLAYTKETRNDPDDESSWSEGQPSWVRPTSGLGFSGPVAALTGRRSVSAAETFAMALMGREPEIQRIGQTTQGVFSDVLTRTLPNGWRFGLSNERFVALDGRVFEGSGVPPNIEVPVFTPAELEAGIDSALDKALELLSASADPAG